MSLPVLERIRGRESGLEGTTMVVLLAPEVPGLVDAPSTDILPRSCESFATEEGNPDPF